MPGIGSRLSSTLTTNMKARNASAAKKATFEYVTQPAWPGIRNGAAASNAQNAVPTGPANDTSESQRRLRSAAWSMYTAPPGSAIPPSSRKMTGKMMLISRLV